ncbi:hypothetical protein CF326_g8220 [Tilletia indica]|nr:hypothetical protein CF326_g8220 [Tilletia indica]
MSITLRSTPWDLQSLPLAPFEDVNLVTIDLGTGISVSNITLTKQVQLRGFNVPGRCPRQLLAAIAYGP